MTATTAPRTITARYPGVCALTNTSYSAGDRLEHTPEGWARAGAGAYLAEQARRQWAESLEAAEEQRARDELLALAAARTPGETLDALLEATPAAAHPRLVDGVVHATLTTITEGWTVNVSVRVLSPEQRARREAAVGRALSGHLGREQRHLITMSRLAAEKDPVEEWRYHVTPRPGLGLHRQPQWFKAPALDHTDTHYWHVQGLEVTVACPEYDRAQAALR